jgi:acetylornithine/succinyldiaminopimelate/putrescine aminotransferase
MCSNQSYLIPIIPFSDIVVSHGKGSYVFDIHGRKYLDLNSGQFCAVFGHSNENLLGVSLYGLIPRRSAAAVNWSILEG